jgi:hypothetical protein
MAQTSLIEFTLRRAPFRAPLVVALALSRGLASTTMCPVTLMPALARVGSDFIRFAGSAAVDRGSAKGQNSPAAGPTAIQ